MFSEEASSWTYDLPANSRKLAALNVTLRRSHTPQSEYAKLSLSKEALLLRSGVTLRRGRESLSSLSSYASHADTEGGERQGGGASAGNSDEDDEVLEPINKSVCISTSGFPSLLDLVLKKGWWPLFW